MKLNEALQRAMITVKKYIDKVTPTKLSDLEIDMELGITNVVANIEARFDVSTLKTVYSCDKTFAELWEAYESDKNILFCKNGLYASSAFRSTAISSNGAESKRIYIQFIVNKNLTELYINEDNVIVESCVSDMVVKSSLVQETGMGAYAVMSQRAVTNALDLKADDMSHEESIELLTETGFISPLTNANGDVYTNAKGDVYVL